MLIVFKLLFGYFGFQAAIYLGENTLAGLGIGLFVGHVLDYGATIRLAEWRAKRMFRAQVKAELNDQFLSSLFLMIGQICGIDGKIGKDEIQAVERLITETLKLSRKERSQAIKFFKSARATPTVFQSNAVRFVELYNTHPEILDNTILLFFNVAVADGRLTPEEEKLIHTAASVFGIDQARYQQMRAPYVGHSGDMQDIDRCYAILGCKKSDSDAEIKRNYRKLAANFHPDKIVSKGLPQEFLEFAHQKFKDIQGAYELVKEDRGLY